MMMKKGDWLYCLMLIMCFVIVMFFGMFFGPKGYRASHRYVNTNSVEGR